MEVISNLIDNLIFVFERFGWLSLLDVALVTAVFFGILLLLRDTQAVVLLRGVLLLLVLIGLMSSLDVLPAFSWLVNITLPALVVAIPVVFAPEIRRALERLGRAGPLSLATNMPTEMEATITAVINGVVRLSQLEHGALIVLQRRDNLEEYTTTGVRLNARVTPELLLQIFYPNTPLHDGAVIIVGSRLVAASCVMPLSSSGVLARSAERRMGLRHRAALGISEVSDAVVVVVSEETGTITVVHEGRLIRRLDAERLHNVLRAFYWPEERKRRLPDRLARFLPPKSRSPQQGGQ
ncbi:MAG: diadenylate cyclase CdaA [Chloroflexota bacterium]